MTGSRLTARRRAALARLRELGALGDGWLDGEGRAVTARALRKVGEIYGTHAAIAAHAALFPTLKGGLLIEFTRYPLDAEILVTPSGVVRASVTENGEERSCTTQELDRMIVSAMTVVTSDIEIALEYDCMPVIARLRHADADMVCLGLAAEDPLGDMMGIMIDGDVGRRLKAGEIDYREAILDPRSHVFAVTITDGTAYMQEIMDEIQEISLPNDGLTYAGVEGLVTQRPALMRD